MNDQNLYKPNLLIIRHPNQTAIILVPSSRILHPRVYYTPDWDVNIVRAQKLESVYYFIPFRLKKKCKIKNLAKTNFLNIEPTQSSILVNDE